MDICTMAMTNTPNLSAIPKLTCPHCGDEISSEEFIKHGIQKQLDEHVQSTLQAEKELVKEQMESLAAQERDLQANLSKLVNQRLDQEKKKMREEVGKEFQNVIETNREELKQKSIELRRMRELEDEAERLKRKKEQGSMQAQGEAQEVLIEQKLRDLFPTDVIEEVKKGANGADCIQHVHDGMVQTTVKIYYESKRTKAFSPSWIAKFKEDIHRLGADAGVLVTAVMPKGMTKPGLFEGVWVCQLQDLPLLSQLLRKHVLKYSAALVAQESKGTKMELLYNYLTSEQFANSIVRVLDRFSQLRDQLEKERRSLQKSWSKREKLLIQAYESLLDVNSSIQTIGGSDMDLLDRGFDALAE